jgi:hypothetical protein
MIFLCFLKFFFDFFTFYCFSNFFKIIVFQLFNAFFITTSFKLISGDCDAAAGFGRDQISSIRQAATKVGDIFSLDNKILAKNLAPKRKRKKKFFFSKEGNCHICDFLINFSN